MGHFINQSIWQQGQDDGLCLPSAQVEAVCSFREGECTAHLSKREARKWEADVIVIGARGAGSGNTRVTLSGVANDLLSGSSVPVLLVRN